MNLHTFNILKSRYEKEHRALMRELVNNYRLNQRMGGLNDKLDALANPRIVFDAGRNELVIQGENQENNGG